MAVHLNNLVSRFKTKPLCKASLIDVRDYQAALRANATLFTSAKTRPP